MFSCFVKKRLIKQLWQLRRAFTNNNNNNNSKIDEKQFHDEEKVAKKKSNCCATPDKEGEEKRQLKSGGEIEEENENVENRQKREKNIAPVEQCSRRRDYSEFKRRFWQIANALNVRQLETLFKVVKCDADTIDDCVLLTVDQASSVASSWVGEIDGGAREFDVFKLTRFFVKTFRLPEISVNSANAVLSPLPWCACFNAVKTMVCVNPYHYGLLRLINSGSPSHDGNYANATIADANFLVDMESSTSTSSCDTGCFVDTSGTCTTSCSRHSNAMVGVGVGGVQNESRYSCFRSRAWCHMAYWEKDVRVGNLLSVDEPLAFCYSASPPISARRLSSVENSLNVHNFHRSNRPERVLATRQKIGRGFVLYKRAVATKDRSSPVAEATIAASPSSLGDEVLLHNLGACPLFVRSNYLHSDLDSAVRLSPGYTLLVHRIHDDGSAVARQQVITKTKATTPKDANNVRRCHGDDNDDNGGPRNPPLVLISFSKCWGSKRYSRPFITCCPCWVEVIFGR